MKKWCIFLSFLLLTGCVPKITESVLNHPFETEIPLETPSQIEQIIENMTLSQKVGQLFMVCLETQLMDQATLDFLKETQVGNVILFTKNIENREQLKQFNQALNATINQITQVRPLIAIDQEGGNVTRLMKEAIVYPGNMAVAAAQNPEAAYRIGEGMALELKNLGINFNFAPVADICSNPQSPIGVRSYGDDPELVANYVEQMMLGLQSENILSCVKHFPGHGDTQVDSHLELPIINHTLEELRQRELIPFKRAIDAGVDAVMSAHILFPSLEPTLTATMSSIILQDILRKELGFEGLIVSDSMRMHAISQHIGEKEGSILALQAGIDCIILGTGKVDEANDEVQKEVILAVVEAVQSGRLDESVIDEHLFRVLTAKQKAGLLDNEIQEVEVDCSPYKAFAEEISQKSITLMKDEEGLIPLQKEASILFLSTKTTMLLDETALSMSEENTFAVLAQKYFKQTSMILPSNPDKKSAEPILAAAKLADTIVIATANSSFYPKQQELINQLIENNPQVVLILLGSPHDAQFYQQAKTILCAYEYTALSVNSLLKTLSGEAKIEGILPVRVLGFNE